jgi:5'-3' exonuclease
MLVDLIIDGNFLLNRLVFTLHKNNLLFGALNKSLDISISNYRKLYPFANIYLVSDSKEKSWRKKININYKANRKKDSDIDWEFVFSAYNEFKESISNKGIKIMESPHIEGDDWISFLVEKANSEERCTFIISNDYDIKQLVTYSISPLFINIMSNEMYNKQKLFLPKNYQIFMDTLNKIENNDIFSLNDNSEFVHLINGLMNKYEVNEVDSIESLIIKLISGDTSDNISSAWSIIKNGRKRGIADKGAKTIYDEYILNFGEPDISDPDLSENIADLICEKKKLSKSSIDGIKNNIENNIKLILLKTEYLPDDILKKMHDVYDKHKSKLDSNPTNF